MTTRISLTLLTWLLAATLMPGLQAQVPPAAPAQPPTPPEAPADVEFERITFGRPAVRIGQDYVLPQGDAIREAVIIMADARIEGRVDQNVVVVLGNVTVTDTAFIDDSLVVIGGTATIATNARIDQDLVIVGGELEAPAGFNPRGEYIVIGSEVLGGRLQGLVPWVTRGLMWGRLIVPDVGWIWGVVLLFFLGYVALNLVFNKAIQTCAQTLVDKPLTAFAVGILALLLFPPVAALLAVSVIGILVIPILVCAMIVGALLGRVAVARWIGMNAVTETDRESKLQGLRSLAIGFAVVCIAYMIPVIGIITFATLGVLGLGTTTLAFMNAYRRENPITPKKTPPPVPPPAPVVPEPGTPEASGPVTTQPSYMAAPALASVAQEAAFPPPPPPSYAPPPPPSGPSGFATVTSTDMLAFPRATFLDRMAALVLDAILVAFVLNIFDVFDEGPGPFFFLLVAYHIGFWTWKATTIGGIIMNLRVIRMDGYRLRFVDALVRGLSGIFSAIVVGLGFLWILRDPERQAWHDRIAGTHVLKVPRQFPL